MILRLGRREFADTDLVLMAIVNRTPDSFFDHGATYRSASAVEAVDRAVAEGADIVDVGGVRAGYGEPVGPAEEIRRVADLVATVRARYPDLVISVDTWRSEVARVVIEAGADLVNDTWAGADPTLAEVAGAAGVGIVCSHTGGLPPRTDPHRVAYPDVVADVLATVTRLARRAVSLGVPRESVLIDPTHDFGKNTRHSLEVTRRLPELVAPGGRCWWRCRTRTSSGSRWTCLPGSGWRAPWPPSRSAPGWAPGCSGSTRCGRPGGRWTWWPPSAAPARPPPRAAVWPEAWASRN